MIAPTKREPTDGDVVRLADLAPAERQLVLALIAASRAAEASSVARATSPDRPVADGKRAVR